MGRGSGSAAVSAKRPMGFGHIMSKVDSLPTCPTQLWNHNERFGRRRKRSRSRRPSPMQLKSISGSIVSWVLLSHAPRLGSALAKSMTISCHTFNPARLIFVQEPRPTKMELSPFRAYVVAAATFLPARSARNTSWVRGCENIGKSCSIAFWCASSLTVAAQSFKVTTL